MSVMRATSNDGACASYKSRQTMTDDTLFHSFTHFTATPQLKTLGNAVLFQMHFYQMFIDRETVIIDH